MNRKNILKIILDTLMLLTLTLLYQKNIVNLDFHEIAGLALLGVFFIHIAINWRWVVQVTKKIVAKGLPAKTRAGWVVDLLLLISFALVGLSGILISKRVFGLNGGGVWKTLHYFCAALCVVLLGVHLGLHSSFAGSMLRRILHLNRKAARVLAIALSVVCIGYGAYSIPNTSFLRWLSMPFSAQQAMGGEGMNRPDFGEQQLPNFADAQTDKAAPQSESVAAEQSQGRGNGQGKGQGKGLYGEHGAKGGENAQGFSLLNALNLFAQYFCIAYVFAAATWLVGRLTRKRKKQAPAEMTAA